jgi:hypothetical protein
VKSLWILSEQRRLECKKLLTHLLRHLVSTIDQLLHSDLIWVDSPFVYPHRLVEL